MRREPLSPSFEFGGSANSLSSRHPEVHREPFSQIPRSHRPGPSDRRARCRESHHRRRRYRQPDGVTPFRLTWQDAKPWKEIVVEKNEIPHSFPMEHTDIVEQVIDY